MKIAGLVVVIVAAACSGPQREVPRAKAPPAAPKITQFYASPQAIPPGERTLLCYGVEGASEVRLEPAVEKLSPSLARCFEVRPQATSTYRLTALSSNGGQTTADVTVTVDPKAPSPTRAASLIRFLTASQTSIPKGSPVTICYGVQGATSVRISPNVRRLEPVERFCFAIILDVSTTFTLTARNAAGVTEQMTLRIEAR